MFVPLFFIDSVLTKTVPISSGSLSCSFSGQRGGQWQLEGQAGWPARWWCVHLNLRETRSGQPRRDRGPENPGGRVLGRGGASPASGSG